MTLRAHYEQAGRSADISEIEVPEAGEHLWSWFWSLERGRACGMNGPEPLAYAEIEAWARLTGTELRPWEVDALKAMDAVRLRGSERV